MPSRCPNYSDAPSDTRAPRGNRRGLRQFDNAGGRCNDHGVAGSAATLSRSHRRGLNRLRFSSCQRRILHQPPEAIVERALPRSRFIEFGPDLPESAAMQEAEHHAWDAGAPRGTTQKPHGRFAVRREFTVDQVFDSTGRTITDTRPSTLRVPSVDRYLLPSNEYPATRDLPPRRRAFGPARVTRAMCSSSVYDESVIATLSIDGRHLLRPIFVGDTFKRRNDARQAVEQGPSGIIDRSFVDFNQHGDAVQEGR